jgi:hypothetical protein
MPQITRPASTTTKNRIPKSELSAGVIPMPPLIVPGYPVNHQNNNKDP